VDYCWGDAGFQSLWYRLRARKKNYDARLAHRWIHTNVRSSRQPANTDQPLG
ncbi:unnamed protein product, partial [Sphacelaria rigidula]